MNSERRTPPWWFSVISHLWRGGKVVYKDWIKVTLITRVQVRSYGDIFRLKSLTWHLVLCPPPPQTWNLSNLSHKYIPKFRNFTRDKTRKLRHSWPKLDIAGCFTHLFWTNCQFVCNYLLKYKLTHVLWKLWPEFVKFHRWGNFLHLFLKNLPQPQNILHKWHLWLQNDLTV